MNKQIDGSEELSGVGRVAWTKPELVTLDAGMTDVQNRPNSTPDSVLGMSSLS